MVEQRVDPVHYVRYPECALRIKPGKLIVAAMKHGKLSPVAEYAIDNAERYLTMICGNNHEDRIPPKQRMQLKRAGFSFHNLP